MNLLKQLPVFAILLIGSSNFSSRPLAGIKGRGLPILNQDTTAPGSSPLHFRKQLIANESYESVDVFDVNNDKRLDIVSGAFWYEGPGFIRRHYIGTPSRYGEYYNDFSTVPMDVDGDGWTDFITGCWADSAIYWRKNPGPAGGEWKNFTIGKTGNVETTRAWDIDGDGIPEIIPNNPGKPLMVSKLILYL